MSQLKAAHVLAYGLVNESGEEFPFGPGIVMWYERIEGFMYVALEDGQKLYWHLRGTTSKTPRLLIGIIEDLSVEMIMGIMAASHDLDVRIGRDGVGKPLYYFEKRQ